MIGVFDSGVGGLTVLKALGEKLPDTDFIYLGDTARLPYGSKSPKTIRQYVEQNINYLIQQNVEAIVVACNSASSVLRAEDQWPVPVFNVIDPGADQACLRTNNLKIGVIGTRATVNADVYLKAIKKRNLQAQVFQQACPLLVPLVEEGWVEDPITNLVVFRYLNPLKEKGIDTLVMGCTHYPVLKNAFAKVMGPSVSLVDSAQSIAENLSQMVYRKKASAERVIRICATDLSPTFQQIATQLLTPLQFSSIESIDLTAEIVS